MVFAGIRFCRYFCWRHWCLRVIIRTCFCSIWSLKNGEYLIYCKEKKKLELMYVLMHWYYEETTWRKTQKFIWKFDLPSRRGLCWGTSLLNLSFSNLESAQSYGTILGGHDKSVLTYCRIEHQFWQNNWSISHIQDWFGDKCGLTSMSSMIQI